MREITDRKRPIKRLAQPQDDGELSSRKRLQVYAATFHAGGAHFPQVGVMSNKSYLSILYWEQGFDPLIQVIRR